MSTRKWVGGVEVLPGAVVPHGGGRALSFSVVSVCEATQPEAWHGEVRFDGVTVIRTRSVGDYGLAAREAEQALRERVVALFST